MLYKTSFFWLRFFRRKTYPWMILAIAICKLTYLYGTEQDKEIRLKVAIARIVSVSVYAFMNDLLW